MATTLIFVFVLLVSQLRLSNGAKVKYPKAEEEANMMTKWNEESEKKQTNMETDMEKDDKPEKSIEDSTEDSPTRTAHKMCPGQGLVRHGCS